MTRKEFEELVFDTYNVRADYLFEEVFNTAVFSSFQYVKTVCTCDEYFC